MSYLHFYYDVVADPSAVACFKRRLWQKLYDHLRQIDYKPKRLEHHSVPTKHKLFYKLSQYARKKMFSCHHEMTPEQDVICELMFDFAEKQVNEAVKECEARCEMCGSHFGDEHWNPACTTTGWIKLICEDCAVKNSYRYYKGKHLYFNRKKVTLKKPKSKSDNKKVFILSRRPKEAK